MINLNIKLQGFYRLQVIGGDGTCRKDTGWFPNLITTQGIDWFGAGVPVYNTSYSAQLINTHCGVGTGNTPPAFTDTQLNAPLAMYPASSGSNVEGFTSSSYVPGPPAYWSGIWQYNFAQGAVVGNIAEVGVGGTLSGDTTPRLFSRALILDGSGNPTTISVISTDSLIVTYELRHYLDLTDNSYSVVVGDVTYSGIYRRAQVTTVPSYYLQCDWGYNGISFAATCNVYNGSIGTTSQTPSGASGGGGNQFSTTGTTYNPGSLFKGFTVNAPVGYGNLSGGITALMVTTNFGSFQFSISPPIPKTNVQTMSLSFNVSWARY